MTKQDRIRLAAGASALLAAGVWLGGLLVLGAIVAPAVFGEVSMPDAANAMTIVFVTFDKIAISAAAVIAVAEVIRIRAEQNENAITQSKFVSPLGGDTLDFARLVVIAISGTLAIVQGAWLSPAIVALHREGAVRGLGPAGEKLETIHAWSERCGKTESVLLIALVVLLAHALIVRSRPHADRAH